MNFYKNYLKNDLFLRFFICILFCIYAFQVLRNTYDGHHFGLIYSNAIDLLNGKEPYKEIFIQYGIITPIINSLVLFLSNNKAIFIYITTIFFYASSVLLISEIIKKKINVNYSYLTIFLILFNHPIPWLPWSNYTMFFFIILSIYLLCNKENYFLFGFFISLGILSRQELFLPVLISFLFWIFIELSKNKIVQKKKNLAKILIGFSIPLFLFLIFLYLNDIFNYWYQYLYIPNYYLDLYGTNLFNLILEYIRFFITDGFFSFVVTPQYLLISIILISNTLFIIGYIIGKLKFEKQILYISILSICLSTLSLKIEIFRVYTSVIIGLIPLLIFIKNLLSKDLKNRITLSLVAIMTYSFLFYNFGNNPLFTKTKFSENLKLDMEQYRFFKWPKNKVKSLKFINELSNNCEVEFLENITFDTLLGVNPKYKRIKLLPYEKASIKNSNFHKYLNNIKNPNTHYFNKINLEIKKKNIILLLELNNNLLNGKEIIFDSSYKVYKINKSLDENKPNFLKIYYPEKCSI